MKRPRKVKIQALGRGVRLLDLRPKIYLHGASSLEAHSIIEPISDQGGNLHSAPSLPFEICAYKATVTRIKRWLEILISAASKKPRYVPPPGQLLELQRENLPPSA